MFLGSLWVHRNILLSGERSIESRQQRRRLGFEGTVRCVAELTHPPGGNTWVWWPPDANSQLTFSMR